MRKKAQVWVETVIYTLIGLSIIALVLGIVKPAIEEKRDAISISQSIDVLNDINAKINEIKYVSGNSRNMEIKLGRGKMVIDGVLDTISIIIEDSSHEESQLDTIVNEGSIKKLTTAKGKKFNVELKLDYKDKLDITYKRDNDIQTFQPATNPYKISLMNNGGDTLVNIDFF